MKDLIAKLENKDAVIGIIGIGYVGQPLILRYSQLGYQVIGFDINQSKVDLFNSGKTSIDHIDNAAIQKAIQTGCEATTNFEYVTKCDALIICVPTPLNKHREPDLSYVIATIDNLTPYLRKNQIISLESTTYPGTTEEEIFPRIEMAGFEVGKDIALVYSPEREDPGNPTFNTKTIPKICGGHTSECLEVGIALYKHAIEKIIPVSSTKVAEMTKLLENIHRAVNIGLVNEMKIVADAMGIDIYEVIRAAATKPFGFTAYYPGPGLGGHCIPIDPFYLTWKAREYNISTKFIEIAGEINAGMPNWVVNKISLALNNVGKSVKNCKILVLGIAYKKNVDDMRESPSVIIMELLSDLGAEISYSDPHVLTFPQMREHSFTLSSVNLTAKTIKQYDCVVLTTDHDKFDYELLKKNSSILIDTRGRYPEPSINIIKA